MNELLVKIYAKELIKDSLRLEQFTERNGLGGRYLTIGVRLKLDDEVLSEIVISNKEG